jgi:hypothetical protein
MKKIVALTCLLGALAFTANAETKALIVNEANPEKSLTIDDGQVATVVFWGGVTLNSSKIKITVGDDTITFDKSSFSELYTSEIGAGRSATTIQQPNFLPVVPGPATITLVKNDASAMITVKIENNLLGGDGNNVTVLPKSVDNMDLVLESSDDMVNWTTDTLGDKPKANRKKFYRLRGKKK